MAAKGRAGRGRTHKSDHPEQDWKQPEELEIFEEKGLPVFVGADGLTHALRCGHSGELPHRSHFTGIAAHVHIRLRECVDIWAAWRFFNAQTVPGLHVEKIHVSLGGDCDMLADLHADWTDGGASGRRKRGWETRLIGDWVNKIRQPDGGVCYVASTSTGVCMNPDS